MLDMLFTRYVTFISTLLNDYIVKLIIHANIYTFLYLILYLRLASFIFLYRTSYILHVIFYMVHFVTLFSWDILEHFRTVNSPTIVQIVLLLYHQCVSPLHQWIVQVREIVHYPLTTLYCPLC
jgi:hypothetical protein